MQKFLLLLAGLFTANYAFAQLPTAAEIAKNMYPGWNLGNTLEAGNNANNFTNNGGLNAEMSWQKTKTSQAVIDYVKQQGFKSVRIPTAWVMGHVNNATDLQIDKAWMARVKEIVDYCIKDDLYVVLNDHWDGGWLEENVSTYSETRAEQLRVLWTQIANEFRDYDEHLLFAGLNEPNASSQSATDNLIKYEQVFVDAVRNTGGNNSSRTLVVQGPSTDIDNTDKYYTALPTDQIADRMMMEVHFYSPYQFCMMTEDASWSNQYYFWGSANHVTSGTWKAYNASASSEESFVENQMKKMNAKFVKKGIPVILGEYGVIWRSFSNASVQKKHDASIKLYHQCVNKYAIQNGIVPFVWDTNGRGTNSMDVLNRETRSLFNPSAYEGIKEGISNVTWPAIASIERVEEDGVGDDSELPAYDLYGNQVKSSSRGFMIKNGHKYFIEK